MKNDTGTPLDASIPTLLLVSLAGVLVAVVGIVAVGQTAATAVLLAAIVVLLVATAVVTRTIARQLDDADGQDAGDDGPLAR